MLTDTAFKCWSVFWTPFRCLQRTINGYCIMVQEAFLYYSWFAPGCKDASLTNKSVSWKFEGQDWDFLSWGPGLELWRVFSLCTSGWYMGPGLSEQSLNILNIICNCAYIDYLEIQTTALHGTPSFFHFSIAAACFFTAYKFLTGGDGILCFLF